MKLYIFRTVPLSINRSFFFTVHTGMEYVMLTACEQFHPNYARKLSANVYDIHHFCVYSEILLIMDRGTVRNV